MSLRWGPLWVLAAILMIPPLRHWMEADMARHMLLQFTLLLAAGAVIFSLLPAHVSAHLAHWNRLGVTGFVFASLTLAYWMIPAALDASLARTDAAFAKYGTLVLSGLALRSSFVQAPLIVQAFFVGNFAWMTATVGLLYQDNPRQLCLYYIVEVQDQAGTGLVLLAMLVAVAWCWKAARHVPAHSQVENVGS